MYTTSTKTQYAGIDAHMALIKLLRYLKEKYFKEFELDDAGKFWETDDEKILLEQFTRYELELNIVIDALRKMKTEPGETVESLAERIEKVLKERPGKTDDIN
jgi:hypothetical protein